MTRRLASIGKIGSLSLFANSIGRGATAGDAGDADLVGIDVGSGAEIIDGTDAVPAFDGGGAVADRMPPEAIVVLHLLGIGDTPRREMPPRPAIGAVMDAGNFTEL